MEGPDVGGGHMAAVNALTITQLRKEISASTEYAAHFHVQVEQRKDRD